jgi:hypothetical protein
VPPGSRSHIDFGAQFSYDRQKAKHLLQGAGTQGILVRTEYDFQRYGAENIMTTSITSLPFLQAARTSGKGDEHLHGLKICFETTWWDRLRRSPRGIG